MLGWNPWNRTNSTQPPSAACIGCYSSTAMRLQHRRQNFPSKDIKGNMCGKYRHCQRSQWLLHRESNSYVRPNCIFGFWFLKTLPVLLYYSLHFLQLAPVSYCCLQTNTASPISWRMKLTSLSQMWSWLSYAWWALMNNYWTELAVNNTFRSGTLTDKKKHK